MGTTIGSSAIAPGAATAAARVIDSTDKLSESLGFEDYIKLMVAQLQNQDMYNSTDTTEMTQQLAQYSLVTAASELIKAQNNSYAASLIGKDVTASYAGSDGKMVTNTGAVTGVTLYEGKPLVYVNGVPYNLSEITIVGSPAAPDKFSSDIAAADRPAEGATTA